MFYQESYNCMVYKSNPKIVEDFDFFIGTLNRNLLNKISVSLIVEKIGVQYELAKELLNYFESEEILEKQFVIVCPCEDCDQILGIISFDKIDEFIRETKECFNCERDNLEIKRENIYVVYKRIKLATTSQEEIADTLEERNVISKRNDDINFIRADLLSEDDIYKYYYNPNKSALKKIKKGYDNLKNHYTTTTQKGSVLEELVNEIFLNVKCFDTSMKYRTETNQIDVTVTPKIKVIEPAVLDFLIPYFVCECKNEKKVSGNTYYHKLFSVIESTDARVGILFSIESCAKTCKIIAREKYLSSKKYLINITKKDLQKIIDQELSIFQVLKAKIDAISLSSNTLLKELGLDYK